MSKPLACFAAVVLAATAAPALAQESGSVTINSSVPAHCETSTWSNLALGSLVDTATGLLLSDLGTAGATSSAGRYYCNAPSTVTLAATSLTASSTVPVQDSTSFANSINYVATLTWTDFSAAVASAATATGTSFDVDQPKNGVMQLKLGGLATPNGRRPIASDYAGSVTITVALK